MAIFGPDLSNNNWTSSGEIGAFLEDCFHREGYSWLEHKVSEGNYYADPDWSTAKAWCDDNGVPVIGYHYVTTDDPAAQARLFVSNGGGTHAMLDFEANSGDIPQFWRVVDAFNDAGVTIALSYIPHWYWQNIGSPDLSQVPGLIASSYYQSRTYGWTEYTAAGGDSGPGWQPYGGATPVIWQFSDSGLIDGKYVDVNAYRGTVDELRTLLGYTTPAPTPAPTPTPTTVPVVAALVDYPAIPKPAAQAEQVSQEWDQLLIRWDFLGDRTPVETLGAIGAKLGILGCTDPKAEHA